MDRGKHLECIIYGHISYTLLAFRGVCSFAWLQKTLTEVAIAAHLNFGWLKMVFRHMWAQNCSQKAGHPEIWLVLIRPQILIQTWKVSRKWVFISMCCCTCFIHPHFSPVGKCKSLKQPRLFHGTAHFCRSLALQLSYFATKICTHATTCSICCTALSNHISIIYLLWEIKEILFQICD